MILTEQSVI